jgi:hypothetical protein
MRSDANLKAYLPSTYVNRWLAVRLEYVFAYSGIQSRSYLKFHRFC